MIHDIATPAIPLLRMAVNLEQFIDSASLLQLAFFAIVARASARHLSSDVVVKSASILGGVILPLYFFRRSRFQYEFPLLVETLLRSLLVYHLTISIASVIITVLSIIMAHLRRLRNIASKRFSEAQERREERRRIRNARKVKLPPPRPLPTFDEKLQSFAKQARADYDAELRMLQALPLDRDEFEVLAMQAKRRLLQKLRART